MANRLIELLRVEQLSQQMQQQAALAVTSILSMLPLAASRLLVNAIPESLQRPLYTPAALLIRQCCSGGAVSPWKDMLHISQSGFGIFSYCSNLHRPLANVQQTCQLTCQPQDGQDFKGAGGTFLCRQPPLSNAE